MYRIITTDGEGVTKAVTREDLVLKFAKLDDALELADFLDTLYPLISFRVEEVL